MKNECIGMDYEFPDPENSVVEENQQDLKERTKAYALRIILLYGALPGTKPTNLRYV